MRFTPRLRFLDAFVFAMPLLLLLLLHVGISFRNFITAADRYFTIPSLKHHARQAVHDRLVDLFTTRRITFEVDNSPARPQNLYLDVSASDLDGLLTALPESGERKINALLNRTPVRVSLRGSGPLHWLQDPRSLRVRTRRKALYRGRRDLVLSVKAILEQHAAYRLAERFGILAPDTDVVNVFLNGKFYSSMLLIERIDQSMLLAHGRMPGIIYKGENFFATKGDYPCVSRWLFQNPYVWTQVGKDRPGNTELEELARLLADHAPGSQHELERLFDLEEMAAFLALQLLCNDSHVDDWHNQRLYLDPLDGKFHPIFWDTGLRAMDFARTQQSRTLPDTYKSSMLMARLARNPAFMQSVFRVLDTQIRQRATIDEEATYLSRLSSRLKDPRRLLRFKFNSTADVGELLRRNADAMDGLLQDARVSYATGGEEHPELLVFTAEGRIGARVEGLRLRPESETADVALYADKNRNGRLDTEDTRLPAMMTVEEPGIVALSLDPPLAITPGFGFHGRPRDTGAGLRQEPLRYPLLAQGFDAFDVEQVLATSVLPGRPVEVAQGAFSPEWLDTVSLHPWDDVEAKPRTVQLAGAEVVLDADLVLSPIDELKIQAGTTIRLGAGVSILAGCRVTWEGTAAQPIRFVPFDAEEPYGVVALCGDGADGSRLTHVHFEGGSLERARFADFSGMLSVHRAHDVVIRDCSFGINHEGDDVLRAADAGVEVVDCVFSNARSDAVDFDYTQGSIVNCTFSDVGNDAIDLMDCDPLIMNNVMTGCGDKGVSIGNASDPVLFNNRIEHCLIGVEIKDGSRPVLVNNLITENGTGLHGYAKNWRYGQGARGRAHNCAIVRNKQDLCMNGDSEFHLYDSVLSSAGAIGSACNGSLVVHRTQVVEDAEPGRTHWPGGDEAVYLEQGLVPDHPAIGLVEQAAAAQDVEKWVQFFAEDFVHPTDGWEVRKGIRLMRKTGEALRIDTSSKQVVAARDLPVKTLSATGRKACVIELRTDRPVDWEVVLRGQNGEMLSRFTARGEQQYARHVHTYDGPGPSRVELSSRNGPSSMWLRELRLCTVAQPEEQALP